MEAIRAELEKIKSADKPANEQATCEWVIKPILEAAGYERYDIYAQERTNAGIPDYTILPKSESKKWVLEAKSWSNELKSAEATQAVNYANDMGARWVVLTNGRQWDLFDNHIKKTTPEKRVISRNINDEDFADFIQALGKKSILTGGLENYVERLNLDNILKKDLISPESKLTRGIVKLIRNTYENCEPTAQNLASFFEAYLTQYSLQNTIDVKSNSNIIISDREKRPRISSGNSGMGNRGASCRMPLPDIAPKDVSFGKPISIVLDGENLIVDAWHKMFPLLVKYSLKIKPDQEFPWFISHHAGIPYLAKQGNLEVAKMRKVTRFEFEGQVYLAKQGHSAASFMKIMSAYCKKNQINSNLIVIEWIPGRKKVD